MESIKVVSVQFLPDGTTVEQPVGELIFDLKGELDHYTPRDFLHEGWGLKVGMGKQETLMRFPYPRYRFLSKTVSG